MKFKVKKIQIVNKVLNYAYVTNQLDLSEAHSTES